MLCGFVRGKEAPVGKRLHYCTSPPDQEKGFEFSHYLFLYLFLIYGARSCTSRFRKSTENNFLLVKLSVKIDYNYSEQLTCINFFQCFWITPFFCGYRNWHSFIHAERLYSLIAEEKGFSKVEVIFFFLAEDSTLIGEICWWKKVCWWRIFCMLVTLFAYLLDNQAYQKVWYFGSDSPWVLFGHFFWVHQPSFFRFYWQGHIAALTWNP